jgi:hypothetical protein
MNKIEVSAIGSNLYGGRDKRLAEIPDETVKQLNKIGLSLNRPDFTEQQIDRYSSAEWLAQKMQRPSAEVHQNFDAYARAYWGKDVTPSTAYDKIVEYESQAMQAMGKPKPVADKPQASGDGEQAVSAEAKPWQFARTFTAGTSKAGYDTLGGTLSMVEGAANTLGGVPRAKGISAYEGYTKALFDYADMERNGLTDTDAARQVMARIEAGRAKLDEDFKARIADYRNTIRGGLAGKAREGADFFHDLGESSFTAYEVDPAYRESTFGKVAEMGGSMVATSAMLAAGSLGFLGRMKGVATVAADIAGTGQTYGGIEEERKAVEGKDYSNSGWTFVANLANAGGQQFVERASFLDNTLERAMKRVPHKGGKVAFGAVLRELRKESVHSGLVEFAEGLLQNAWGDFITDNTYDDTRIDISDGKMDILQRYTGQALADFAGGMMLGTAFGAAKIGDRNILARKSEAALNSRKGELLTPEDFKHLRNARTDEQIKSIPNGDILLEAANGDIKAQGAYNNAVVADGFISTDGMETANGQLGSFEGKPAFIFDSGEALVFDLTKPEQAKRWGEIQQIAVGFAQAQEERNEKALARGTEGEQALTDMLYYVEQLQAERGGKTTIETDANIKGLEEQFGRAGAEQIVADYVKAGMLPEGTTLDTLDVTQGASETKWDDKTRQFVTAIRIAKGAAPMVVMEESAHDYFKRQMELGQFNEDTVHNWRKEVEAGWEGKMEYVEMHEWLAKYAVGYAVGKVQGPDAQNLPLSFKRFLERFAEMFRESLDFAAKVMQMERDGVLPAQFLRALQEATGTTIEKTQEIQRQADRRTKRDELQAVFDQLPPEAQLIAQDAENKLKDFERLKNEYRQQEALQMQAVKNADRKADAAIAQGLEERMREVEFARAKAEQAIDDAMNLPEGMELSAQAQRMMEQWETYSLKALDESTRGNPVYARGGEETFSLSDSRAKPADASKVTVLPDGAQLVGPTTFSITAFHGTPHKYKPETRYRTTDGKEIWLVDGEEQVPVGAIVIDRAPMGRQRMDKIGTGEGAQAYGYGLYNAESKAVGEMYKEKLGPGRGGDSKDVAQRIMNAVGGDATKALAEVASRRKTANIAGAKEKFDEVESIIRDGSGLANLYTVELLPDADEFLDWDKPLSEQSDKVKGALAKVDNRLVKALAEVAAGGRPRDVAVNHGVNLMDLYIGSGGALVQSLGGDAAASKKLLAAGIPGIRFLDGSSRNVGEGTRNYVIFDESLVKIIAENNKKVEQAGATFSLAAVDDFIKGSTVVNSDGSPKEVYHGSPDIRGILKGGFAGGWRGSVFFFTDSKQVAETYADDSRAFDYQAAEPHVVSVFLSLKNPMVVDAKGARWRDTEKYIEEAVAKGHDGIEIRNSRDEYNDINGRGKVSTVYAVFTPSQIRSSAKSPYLSRVDQKSLGLPTTFSLAQTDTPAFKAWFGDSKVVDAQGKPLVVYHGTDVKFNVFDLAKAKKGLMGKGFYFTDSEESARKFGAHVIAVYLKIERPYIRSEAKPASYDGEIGLGGPGIAIGGKQYLVTNPAQIKSATGNRGTFDPANPDITFSIAPNGGTGTPPASTGNTRQSAREARLSQLTPMERALQEKADIILGEQRMAHWQSLGLAAIADLQAQTYASRVKAVGEATRAVKSGTGEDVMGRLIMTISSELDRLAKGLGVALNRTTHENQRYTARGVKTMVALGDKINTLKNANEVFLQFQTFGRRDDRQAIEALAKINGFTTELQAAEAELVDIRRTAIEAGVPTGKFWSEPANWEETDAYKADMKAAKQVKAGRVGEAVERVLAKYGFTKNIDFYWPSKVFDKAGLAEFLRGEKSLPEMTRAYQAIEAEAISQNRDVTEADLNTMMAKLVGNTRGKAGPSSLKGRTIANENINFAVMQFYYSPIEAAIIHVESMRKNIQQRQFFGKSINLKPIDAAGLGVEEVDLTESAKSLLAVMAARGEISDTSKEQLSKLIDARFAPTPQNRFTSVVKALGYVTSLGQAYSGQTATIDALAIGLREDRANPLNIFTGIIQAATGKNFITLEDAGIDTKDLGEGFITDKKWENQMVQYVFEKIGMKYFARFYAQSGINQAMNTAMAMARKGEFRALQMNRLNKLFGERAGDVIADLAAGRKTDDVIFYAWATYSNYQIASLDQQSYSALTSNTGKIMFQFKSFLTVQFSGMRDNGWNEIRSGEPKRVAAGVEQLLTLAAALLICGLPADMLRSFLTGRTFILDEQICARLMGMIGVSPYLVRTAAAEPTKAAASLIIPSFGGTLTDMAKDVKMVKDIIVSDADVSYGDVLGKMRVWQNTPIVGKILAGRLGSQAEKNREDREKIGWFVLTAPEDEEGDARKMQSLRDRLEKEFNTND